MPTIAGLEEKEFLFFWGRGEGSMENEQGRGVGYERGPGVGEVWVLKTEKT